MAMVFQGNALWNGNPNCLMLRSTPDGVQFYATTNQLCAPCAERVKNHLQAPVVAVRTADACHRVAVCPKISIL
jgi:hypothetical protein